VVFSPPFLIFAFVGLQQKSISPLLLKICNPVMAGNSIHARQLAELHKPAML
jgi:hypothetical protein